MDFLKIFLIGASAGIIFSIISMILINASNSEKYPVGGFMPALLMVTDMGISSQIVVAGILIMGGMTGFYLTLTFWKERPESLIDKLNYEENTSNASNQEITKPQSSITVKGKSLSQFL